MINWTEHHDSHGWGTETDQKPLNAQERETLEQIVVDTLGLAPADALKVWGTAHPPGRHACTVIHVNAGLRHRFTRHGVTIGVKLFNESGDSTWLPKKMIQFHTMQRKLLPGLPNSHVQEVLDGGVVRASDGSERKYLIQQWIAGENLEKRMKSPISQAHALQIMDDLFLRIVIPLWSVGSFWWDVRTNNYVVTPEHRLIMIDSDVLEAYIEEKLANPPDYSRRNRMRHKPLERYPTLLHLTAMACLGSKTHRKRDPITRYLKKLFDLHLRAVLIEPYPLKPNWSQRAVLAYQTYRTGYESLLTNPSTAISATRA